LNLRRLARITESGQESTLLQLLALFVLTKKTV